MAKSATTTPPSPTKKKRKETINEFMNPFSHRIIQMAISYFELRDIKTATNTNLIFKCVRVFVVVVVVKHSPPFR